MNKYRCSDCGCTEDKPFTSCPDCCASKESSDKWECIAMKNPKMFNVGFWYTEYADIDIEASSQEEADQIVMDKLSYAGIDAWDGEHSVNDRDYGTA